MPRKALVTGVTGFLGSRLAAHLQGRGWEVHGLVRPASKLDALGPARARVQVHTSDGSLGALTALAAEVRPDVVFHLATLFIAVHKPSDVDGLVESNVAFGARLCEAMVAAGCTRLVNTGTIWQHFEGRAYSPVSLYAATKEALRAILRYYSEVAGLHVLNLGLTDTYGPRDRRLKVLRALRLAAAEGRTMEMNGGEVLVDLVHTDDVVRGFERAAELVDEAPWQDFLLSSGAPVTLRELVDMFTRVTGRTVRVEWGRKPYRAREMFTVWDGAVARLPGWSPRIGLEEGIRQLSAEPLDGAFP